MSARIGQGLPNDYFEMGFEPTTSGVSRPALYQIELHSRKDSVSPFTLTNRDRDDRPHDWPAVVPRICQDTEIEFHS